MPNDGNGLRRTDGQFSWLAGVNSDAPRTKRIPGVLDDGLLENQASWLINCLSRGGGIRPRYSFHAVIQNAIWSGRFQGGMIYQPDAGHPIAIVAVGGQIYRIRLDTDNSVTNLTQLYGVPILPTDATHFYFEQAEMFLIIQVGDYVTLPLIYDFGLQGVGGRVESLRQSLGIVAPGDPTNEIPPAGPMKYYANRLWYAFGRGYAAGDMVGNLTSGSAAYDYRDSVIKVTENPVAYAGDSFRIPIADGDIRALAFSANIDSQLGDSQLSVFTRRSVFSCVAPVTRTAWTAADNDTQPLQRVALAKGGAYSDRSVVVVNDDLFFQSPPNGDLRSLITGQRQKETWGQVPLSNNINRLLEFNDRSLLHDSSGILFDNLLLMTALPVEIPGIGTGHQGIAPLDFDPISTLQERAPPSWQGVWDMSGGPYVLQLYEGDFGGRERAFMAVWSIERSAIEIWEIRNDLRFDHANGQETSGDRVTWIIELPAYAFGDPFELKELDTMELWFDKLLGTVDLEVDFRPDAYACWIPWHRTKLCAAKDCREDPDNPCADTGYPQERWCEQDAIPVLLPTPPTVPCIPRPEGRVERAANWGFQFQVRLKITGWCRLRADILYAFPRKREPYSGIACESIPLTAL